MKFYSEITKKLYDTKDELVKAEVDATKSKSIRAEKAKEVTELIKKANEIAATYDKGGKVTDKIDLDYLGKKDMKITGDSAIDKINAAKDQLVEENNVKINKIIEQSKKDDKK